MLSAVSIKAGLFRNVFLKVLFSFRSRNLQCQRIFQVNAPINCVCLHPNQVSWVIFYYLLLLLLTRKPIKSIFFLNVFALG